MYIGSQLGFENSTKTTSQVFFYFFLFMSLIAKNKKT